MEILRTFDHLAIDFARRHGLRLLRLALGVVFIWFGVLKVVGRSPVERLVADTVPFIDPSFLVPALGAAEIVVGLGLITLVATRLTFLLFFLQMLGTFAVLVVNPNRAFQDGNPLLLTTLGEFVLKNLVLLSAGIAIAARSVGKIGPSEGLAKALLKGGTL